MGLFIFSYLLIIGAIIGLIIFITAFIQSKIIKLKREKKKSGRIIEHNNI